MNQSAAFTAMTQKGWFLDPNVLQPEQLYSLAQDLQTAYETRRRIQVAQGIAAAMDGTCHHLVEKDNSFLHFLTFLDEKYQGFLNQYFDGKYILNSFGGMTTFQSSKAYTHNMHRDVRSFTSDINLMINVLIMLDDFTLENGATHILTGSHLKPEIVSDDFFMENADRIVGPKGSVLFFDSRVWHASGMNQTTSPRQALTLTLTKPFMKQQLDYPRYLGYEQMNRWQENLLQILGYYSRVPATLEEWYQRPNTRFYRSNQE